MAIVAPANTPKDVVERMSREINAILQEPKTREAMARTYMEPIGTTPDGLRQWMVEERDRWAPVIKRAGLTAN